MSKYNDILLKCINGNKYFNNEELRMNKKVNILLNSFELKEYLLFKENINNEYKKILPLKSFDSKYIYYL